METAHCGEVRGESFAVSSLKLLDEELYVGGDDFFGRLRFRGRGKGSNIAGFVRGGDGAHWVNPPFLNGLAVFAHKHALALAHASEGGKCNGVGKVTAGQPKAGGSEYLELHGAFSITLRAPGAALLSKVWFPCFALSAGRCIGLVLRALRARRACRGGAERRRLLPAAGWEELPPASERIQQTDLLLRHEETNLLLRHACRFI